MSSGTESSRSIFSPVHSFMHPAHGQFRLRSVALYRVDLPSDHSIDIDESLSSTIFDGSAISKIDPQSIGRNVVVRRTINTFPAVKDQSLRRFMANAGLFGHRV